MGLDPNEYNANYECFVLICNTLQSTLIHLYELQATGMSLVVFKDCRHETKINHSSMSVNVCGVYEVKGKKTRNIHWVL